MSLIFKEEVAGATCGFGGLSSLNGGLELLGFAVI
jgi:hypothetical protein